MRVGVLCALLAVALAGCSGAAQDAAVPEHPSTAGLTVIVVDSVIRPLAHANVTLSPGNATAQTDAQGTAHFSGLAAGGYLVAAEQGGFIPAKTTVTVGSTDSTVRILLVADAPTLPYATTVSFNGYVQASTGLAGAFGQQADPLGVTDCQCTFHAMNDQPGLSRIVLEATWQDKVADPAGPTKYVWRIQVAGGNVTAQGQAPAPIRQVLGSLDFPSQGFRLDSAPGFDVSIFPDAVWPAVSQDYQAFLSLWYRGPPPDGWAIIEP